MKDIVNKEGWISYHSTKTDLVALVKEGIPAMQSSSMPRFLPPILILKKPYSPQYVPQEFLPIQYSVPSSVTPYPITEISWLIMGIRTNSS